MEFLQFFVVSYLEKNKKFVVNDLLRRQHYYIDTPIPTLFQLV